MSGASPPTANQATRTTIDQLRRLVDLLPDDADTPLFVFDAGYDPIAIGWEWLLYPRPNPHSHPRGPRAFSTPHHPRDLLWPLQPVADRPATVTA